MMCCDFTDRQGSDNDILVLFTCPATVRTRGFHFAPAGSEICRDDGNSSALSESKFPKICIEPVRRDDSGQEDKAIRGQATFQLQAEGPS